MKKIKKDVSRFLYQVNRLPFNSQFLSNLTQRKHILCLGDSHTRVFRYISKHQKEHRFRFDVVSVIGATAQGASNPNSKTNALAIFRKRLKTIKPWQYVFLQLGEVDCGFVIWYRANKYGDDIQSQLQRSINNYCKFIEEVRTKIGEKIFVLSAPLPTIQDNQSWGDIANARKEVKASLRERTNLTIQYNQILMAKCRNLNVRFLDVSSAQLDTETGVICSRFINHNRLDHHLDNREYSNLILREMAGLSF